MRPTLVALLTVLSGLVGACSSKPSAASIHANDYDRRCASVADCMPVVERPIGCCGDEGACPTAAIAQDAVAAYTAAREAAIPTCNPAPPCAPPSPAECTNGRVACTNSLCELLLPDAATSD